MSASIGDVASQPLIPDTSHSADAHPLVPAPSGPPTSSSTAAVSGLGATSSTANADGSITTVVTDALGNTASISVSAPAPEAAAAAHPLVSFEA